MWGRGAHSFVGGTEADLRLDGEVTDRVSVWGAGGYGEGGLQVKPDEGERAKADIRLTMVAAGLRGTLAERADGLEAAAKADVLFLRMSSFDTAELEAPEGRVERVRVGLEGAKPFALEGGASVTPELEGGVRHDGGDAETGFGLELGAGLKWSAPGLRLSGNVGVRGLVVHEAADFEKWTVSGSVRHAPATSSGRGPDAGRSPGPRSAKGSGRPRDRAQSGFRLLARHRLRRGDIRPDPLVDAVGNALGALA